VQAVVPTVPAVARGNLRRSIIMASCLGVAAVLVTGLLGHVLMGLFGCVGLALGALNARMVQRAVVVYANSEAGNKKARFTRSVFGRLALITVLAVGVALLVRPDGLGVFVGLAFFQLLMIGGAAVPVFKQLKQS
jgi:peptidoglycan biosynthesis protein MviN/MurJ (putative lipid II flippase)